MAAKDKTKYFWMKMFTRFFDKHEIKILWAKDRDYVLLYIRLLLESVPYHGYLKYNQTLAYSTEDIALLFDIPEEKVSQGLQELQKRQLLEMKDDGTMYLPAAAAMSGYDTGMAIRLKGNRSTTGSNEPDGGSNEPDGGSNEPDGGSNEPNGGSNEPNGGSNEPNGGSNEPVDGFKSGSFEPKDKSIDIRDKNIECVSITRTRENRNPTLKMVLAHIKGVNCPKRIPEDFAKEWHSRMEFGGWLDSNGKDISRSWRMKLLYAWEDEVRKRTSGQASQVPVCNYIVFEGQTYTPTETPKGLRYCIPYKGHLRKLDVKTTTSENVAAVLERTASYDWD